MKMKQVKLQRGQEGQMAWIPSHAAVIGHRVELKEDGLFWDVTNVYHAELEEDYIKKQERNYKSHRKATDI